MLAARQPRPSGPGAPSGGGDRGNPSRCLLSARHNQVIACGWGNRGEECPVRTNTGRGRINTTGANASINGAVALDRLAPVVRLDDTTNADSTIVLFEPLERVNRLPARIYVIRDNARFSCFKVVKEYLKTSRITLVFPPPHAPNLNLIARAYGSSSKYARSAIATAQHRSFHGVRTIHCESQGTRPGTTLFADGELGNCALVKSRDSDIS
jgi:transposase